MQVILFSTEMRGWKSDVVWLGGEDETDTKWRQPVSVIRSEQLFASSEPKQWTNVSFNYNVNLFIFCRKRSVAGNSAQK